MPYYWNIGPDKDFTLTSKFFTSEHPLFLGEYRQAFKKSNLIMDFGHTEGYKKTSAIKTSGSKSHFFSKLVTIFEGNDSSKKYFRVIFAKCF